MKILFAVDGSAQSLAALDTLVRSFAYFRETPKLTLIHVPPDGAVQGGRGARVGKEAIQRYYDEESDAALADAAKAMTARGIPFEIDKRVGESGGRDRQVRRKRAIQHDRAGHARPHGAR